MRGDGDIGVVDEQEIVPRMKGHLKQRADFAVGSQPFRALDELDGEGRKLGLQAFDGRYGRIVERGYPEE